MAPRKKKSVSKQKTNFALQFPSELLLQEALAGLLTRMPNVNGVKILQGAQEYGKDIVFHFPGALGERIFCAAIVKNTKISGKVGSASGARTVLQQAQQCFDTEHIDDSAQPQRIQRVYVMTPYDISPQAINSIAGSLRERSGQVRFLGGADLFDLFRRYWPSFLADEANLITNYLNRVTKALDEPGPVREVALEYSLGDVEKPLPTVYIPQNFQRTLLAYELGAWPALPAPEKLRSGLTSDQLGRSLQEINHLADLLQPFWQWGYVSSPHGRALSQDIKTFAKSLDNAWRTSPKKYQGMHTSEVAPIHNPDLFDKLRALSEELRIIRERIDEDLNLTEVFVRQRATGIQTLSTPQYLRASAVNDLAAESDSQGLPILKRIKDLESELDLHHEQLRESHLSLFIVAPAGYGKTSFCRYNALLDAERYTTGKSDIVPVYITLHQFATRQLSNFEDDFLEQLGMSALIQSEAQQKAGYIRVRVYLDGLDEVTGEKQRKDIVDSARAAIASNPKLQIIITARDYIRYDWLTWLPKIYLRGFTQEQTRKLFNRWLSDNRKVEKLNRELLFSPSLAALTKVPLLATLIVLVYRQTGKLPQNVAKLYEIFVELLAGGWDLAKGVQRRSYHGVSEKLMVLRRLAMTLHTDERQEFSIRDFRGAVEQTIHRGMLRDRPESILAEVVQDGLITKSGEISQFSHLSFQEFLVAKELLGDPSKTKISHAIREFLLGKDWWRGVLRFYIHLSRSPQDIASWLEGEIRRIGVKKDMPSYDSLLVMLGIVYPEALIC